MKLYFLDFEASSLDSNSYPIEIAWVDENGQGESYLINPHWSWKGWSILSESIHHITLDQLRREGMPADDVARRAQTVLSNSRIISDQPAFEQVWLQILLDVINAPRLRVDSIDALLGSEIHRIQAAITVESNSREWHRQSRMVTDQAQCLALTAYEGTQSGATKHRALPDAEAQWRGWKAAREAIDGLIADLAG